MVNMVSVFFSARLQMRSVVSGKDCLLDNEGKILLSMLRAQGLPTAIGLMEVASFESDFITLFSLLFFLSR